MMMMNRIVAGGRSSPSAAAAAAAARMGCGRIGCRVAGTGRLAAYSTTSMLMVDAANKSTSGGGGGSGGSSTKNPDGVFDKIACIGTGKMAEAILQPVIEQGVQPASKISVFDVSPVTMDAISDKFGVNTSTSIPDLIQDADLVLCCVKPQNLSSGFFEELRKGNPTEDSIFLSIIAGKSIPVFRKGGFDKIVRSMPNTPAMIGQGMTVWSCTPNLTADERRKVRDILSSCGKSVRSI